MPEYKIEFSGLAYVEADTEQEAKEKLYTGKVQIVSIYADSIDKEPDN